MMTVFVFDRTVSELKRMKELMQGEGWYGTCQVQLFQNGRRMLEAFREGKERPSIVFLGLSEQIEEEMNLSRELKRMNPKVQLIFAAESQRRLLAACEVEHTYLLLKPVKRSALRKAFFMAAGRLYELTDPLVPIVTRKKTYQVRRKEILYLEKELRLIHVHTDNGVITCYGKFEDLWGYLAADFCRCHNSYVVNLDRVSRLQERMFQLENGEQLVISQKRYQEVKRYYLDYLEGRSML